MMPRARIRDDWLAIAAIAYLAANLLHGVDHIRQELAGVNVAIGAGGAMLTAAGVAAVIVALRHDPRTPLIATFVGLAAAILVAASHIAPHWSVLSDSYIDDVHPDALSWVVVLLEIAAAALLGLVGLHRSRRSAVPSRAVQTGDASGSFRSRWP
jgi:hypothetical protein